MIEKRTASIIGGYIKRIPLCEYIKLNGREKELAVKAAIEEAYKNIVNFSNEVMRKDTPMFRRLFQLIPTPQEVIMTLGKQYHILNESEGYHILKELRKIENNESNENKFIHNTIKNMMYYERNCQRTMMEFIKNKEYRNFGDVLIDHHLYYDFTDMIEKYFVRIKELGIIFLLMLYEYDQHLKKHSEREPRYVDPWRV